MAKAKLICYPKCSTCKKAEKWLKDNNIDVDYRNISVDNPTKEELTVWLKKSKLPISKFFNTSGKIYKEQNLKEKVKSAPESELLTILASNGMIVKRPILIADNSVLVGFNENEWVDKLK